MENTVPSLLDVFTYDLVLSLVWHVTFIGVGAAIVWVPRRFRLCRLKPKVEEAYIKLRNVCEPETLDPQQPGNQEFMKSDARDFVNLLRPRLENAGLYGAPPPCTTDRQSLMEWFRFLATVRTQL